MKALLALLSVAIFAGSSAKVVANDDQDRIQVPKPAVKESIEVAKGGMRYGRTFGQMLVDLLKKRGASTGTEGADDK